MARLIFYIFVMWVLLIPYTVLSSIYLGSVAIDKQIAPALIVVWFLLFMCGKYKLSNKKIIIVLVALFFFLVRNISFFLDPQFLGSVLWQEAIYFGYFCLPIFFIDNMGKIKIATRLISINAVVGCLSGFLVAVGMLTLPYERFSQSRIGFEEIQKSIGLFSTYGDLAQYAANFLLIALFIPNNFSIFGKVIYHNFIKFNAIAIVVLGLIGCQSRSYLLSVLVALFTSKLFFYRSRKTTNSDLFNILFSVAIFCSISIIIYIFSDIVSMLASMGGSQALGTALDRLDQYQYAYSLIRENLFIGVDASYFLKYEDNVHGVHNMWLGQLVRGGLISFFALIWLILLIFRDSFSLLNNHETSQYGAVAVGYLFAVLVSTLFYPADTSLFWVLLGLNVAIVTSVRCPSSRKKV